jgi:imidazolonepropionase-like amidohydrolase
MNNLDAIQAATLNGALVTGLNDQRALREGKRADLLVLNTHPSKSLDALFNPRDCV